MFEPNPKFYNSYDNANMMLIKKAVWIEDTTLPFYVSKDEQEIASSLLQEKLCKVNRQKIPYFKTEPIIVECIDFSKWLRETIKPYCKVTLKLDIEGAEYAVINKMLIENTISLVNELYVEFHLDTLMNKKDEHSALMSALADKKITVKSWD